MFFFADFVIVYIKMIIDFSNFLFTFPRTSLVPMDRAAAAQKAALRTSHTRLTQTVANMIFDRPELGLTFP